MRVRVIALEFTLFLAGTIIKKEKVHWSE